MKIEEMRKRVREILSDAKYTDWEWDGEEETTVTSFDSDKAEVDIVEFIQEILAGA